MYFADYPFPPFPDMGDYPPMNPSNVTRYRNRESSSSWSDVSDHETEFSNQESHKTSDQLRTGLTLDPSSLEYRLSRSLDESHSKHEFNDMPPASLKDDVLGRSNSGQESTNSENDSGETIKNKIMSAWNNMRHGWSLKLKTNFKVGSEIHLLGKIYSCTEEEREARKQAMERGNHHFLTSFEMFQHDFTSRLWFTYRKDFPPLHNSKLTSDIGWGCMLRTGQMMLAQALILHYIGRDWIIQSEQRRNDEYYHRKVVEFFSDNPHPDIPFSVHQLVKIGAESGRQPGDWYGPSSVAIVLRDAMERASQYHPLLANIAIYVAQDCTVYKQDVIDICTLKEHRLELSPGQTHPRDDHHFSQEVENKFENVDSSVSNLNTSHTEATVLPEGSAMFYRKLDLSDEISTVESCRRDGRESDRKVHKSSRVNNSTKSNETAQFKSFPGYMDSPQSSYTESPNMHKITRVPLSDCSLQASNSSDITVQKNRPEQVDISPNPLYANEHMQRDAWKPVVILIPVRLGGDEVNPVYFECLKAVLDCDMSLGIIGGKPKHSLYFIGWQEDKLLYLDPHLCQNIVNTTKKDFNLQSYHCSSPRKLAFTKVDPSCALGFYCHSREDFDRFALSVDKFACPAAKSPKGVYPMFVMAEGRGSDIHYKDGNKERRLRVIHKDKKGNVIKKTSKESDDFVLL